MAESGSSVGVGSVQVEQPNSVRLIYTLLNLRPTDIPHCELSNGFYFAKVTRSDERLRFTETDMSSIVRTILFMYAFDVTPKNSMLDMINHGDVSEITRRDIKRHTPKSLSLSTARLLLDSLFGEHFATVARRAVYRTLCEYMREWRYFGVGATIRVPSANDFIKIYRFVNIISPKYSDVTNFINNNIKDNKMYLQTANKRLN